MRARSANARSECSFTMVVYFCNACRERGRCQNFWGATAYEYASEANLSATWLILPSWMAASASELSLMTASTSSVTLLVRDGFEPCLPAGAKIVSLHLISALSTLTATMQLQLTIQDILLE